MRLTVFSGDEYTGPRMTGPAMMERLMNVVDNELTEKQKAVFEAYFFQNKNIPKIAAETNRSKSSVSRCLNRALARVRRCLKY